MQGLPIPTRNGHRFLGWYSGSQPYDATSLMPEIDLELTAKWEKIATVYSDDYVSLKPATSGVKNEIHEAFGVDQCVYVEITSDDLKGGVDSDNNFTLLTLDGMEYTVKSGYSWIWYYDDDFSVVNGAQRFSLGYGDNLQFVTVNNASGVTVKTYLVNIYVLQDYYIGLHKTVYDTRPYDSVRVIEGELFSAKTAAAQDGDLQFDKRVYLNENSGEYIEFDHSTPITKNWDLYQTYKPVTMRTDLGGGTLAGEVKIKPYTPYANLPLPEKSGFDFLGWKMTGDKYFADITGYTGAKYISSENAADTLTAVFREKKYYFGCGTEKITQSDTVPVITYTDETMTEILEVIYVPYNTDCRVPELTPKKDKAVFCQWLVYDKETKSSEPFDFDRKVTEPIALFADMMPYSGEDTLLALNETSTFNEKITVVVYLPTASEYVLEATAAERVVFKVVTVAGTSASQTATEGSPLSYDLRTSASGYAMITVESHSGSYTLRINGATALTDGDPMSVATDELVFAGTQKNYTINRLGYVFDGFYDGNSLVSDGFYDGNSLVSDDKGYAFTVSPGNKEYRAEWHIDPLLDNFEYDLTDTELVINNVKDKTVTELIVPDYVTSISSGAFSGCNTIESVTLPTMAIPFVPKNNLRTVVINAGDTIPSDAFANCKNLVNITIPNSVTKFGSHAFNECDNLEKVNFTGDIADWCEITFASDRSNPLYYGHLYINNVLTKDIVIPGSVSEIKDYAFFYSDITDISIPDSVTRIGYKAFYECGELTSVTIPKNVTHIDQSAFAHAYVHHKINTIIYCEASERPSSWASNWNQSNYSPVIWDCKNNDSDVDGYAYSDFEGIRYKLKDGTGILMVNISNTDGSIAIPNSVIYKNTTYEITGVDGYSFERCKTLTSVTIPNSVTSIGECAFQYCRSLTSVTISDSVTSIGSFAFYGCGLPNVTVPSGVINIEREAFGGNGKIIIYCEVAEKPNGWASDWISSSLCTVVWSCKNRDVLDGIIYEFVDGNATVIGCDKQLSGSISIPSSVIYKNQTYSVSSIGKTAFSNCKNLTSVTIPNSISSIIGNGVFYGCICVTVYCEAAEKPSEWADDWSSSAAVVWDCKNNDKDDNGYAYTVSNGIRYKLKDGQATVTRQPNNISGSITIPSYVDYKGISYGITSIADEAFYQCGGLTSVMIEDGVTSIGYHAFYNCSGLTSVTIPEGVTRIDSEMFWCCTQLNNVILPNSLNYIGRYVFSGCENLTSIKIPESVTTIDDGAFKDCRGLKNINIPKSVTRIGHYAFQSCTKLTSIIIPIGVTHMGSKAFAYCSNLTIYCEIQGRPSNGNWDGDWNSSSRPVVWNYKAS